MRPFFQHFAWLLRAKLRMGKKGQTIVEYSLILAVIAIACLSAFSLLGNRLIQVFSTITTLLDTAQGSH
jgi:Flp pilus assembly pilin Flp